MRSGCPIHSVIYFVSCGGPMETQAMMWPGAACTLTALELSASLNCVLYVALACFGQCHWVQFQILWIQSSSLSMWMITWRLWQQWMRSYHFRLRSDPWHKREDSVWLIGWATVMMSSSLYPTQKDPRTSRILTLIMMISPLTKPLVPCGKLFLTVSDSGSVYLRKLLQNEASYLPFVPCTIPHAWFHHLCS